MDSVKYRSKSYGYSSKYVKLYRAGYRMTVDARSSRRRLQALQAIGWSLPKLGERLDMTRQQLSVIMRSENRLYLSTAKKIDTLYRELCVQPQFDPYAVRTKRNAQKQGWAPPMAWDDIDNDYMPFDRRDEACGRNRHPASMKREKPNGKWECVGCKNSYRERAAS